MRARSRPANPADAARAAANLGPPPAPSRSRLRAARQRDTDHWPCQTPPFTGFSVRFLHALDFLEHFGPAATLAVCQPDAKAVLLIYFVFRQDVLKVPGRVTGLQFTIAAPARRRMREADAFGPIEHKDGEMIPHQTVEERLVEAQRRKVLEERRADSLAILEFQHVGLVPNRAFVVVRLRAKLLPVAGVAEVHALIVWGVDVA